jgi:hypothetical protein
MRWFGRGASLALFVLLSTRAAPADEPVAASEPRLLSETAETTTVVDAFDRDNPFDLYIYAGFTQTWKRADIHRETELNQPGLSTGGFVANTENIARYAQDISTLNVGADIGIFRDLALTFRMPIILSDARSLSDLNGSSNNPQRLQDPSGAQLFTVPFQSPTRSGIDYFSVGLDWAITNQQRDPTKPTWVIGAEGRFGIGDPLHACNATSGQTICPNPTNAGPNGGAPVNDPTRSPGISRAMYGLDVKTIISKRYGYVEPYTGFEALFEFPRSDSDFGTAVNTGNLTGALVTTPPIIGTFTLGLEVVPWERREAFQRLVFDVRVQGMYSSPGRDYSELFDALGSSTASSLRNPNPGGWKSDGMGGSVADPSAPPVYFTGITDQTAFGAFSAQGTVTWQAGEYVKFAVGGGVKFVESHVITAADPCNPNITPTSDTAGPCRSTSGELTGIPNPDYHAIIDTPGRRFSVDNTIIGNFNVTATIMF